jgi:hypothetical protein
MPYADIDLEWVEKKFGIQIVGKKENPTLLKANEGFFV